MSKQSPLQQQSEVGFVPVLATKFYRPQVTSEYEWRADIIDRLGQNRQRPLTLISAPAGYGKTTLASMWLESIECPSAWLALDEGENNLHSFTSYLVAALEQTFPDATLVTRDLLNTPVIPTAPLLARYLLNDLQQIQEPFVLALDDLYMVYEQSVYDLLNELLRHPSPNLHLLLITRRDPPLPLASLRARRQVTEVRARDLRFDVPAATRLLSRILKQDVDEAIALEWTKRTEGWVTALQLAALSLRHRDEREGLGVKIPEDNRYLQEYLLNEVIERLDPVRQKWLLATSVLDRFCAPLVDAVCWFDDATDSSALTGKEFIRWLQKDNLFLIPLDDQQEWFRFHHLFQALLQQSLQGHFVSENIKALHQRASKWLNLNGLWDEAIQHEMATGSTVAASKIIAQHRYDLMNILQWHRLDKWLQYLPVDHVIQNPSLITIKTHLAIHGQSLQQSDVLELMQHAEQLLSALPPDDGEVQILHAEIAVNQSLIDVLLGKPVMAGIIAQQSLLVLPDRALLVRILADAVIALSQQALGEYGQCVNRLKKISADPDLPFILKGYVLQLAYAAYFMEGDLDRALASSRMCLQIGQRSETSWLIGYARHNLGVTHYLRNEHDQAEPYLRALLEARITSASSYVALGAFALALIHFTRGEWYEGEQVLELASSHFAEITDTFAIGILTACRVELALRKGDLSEAKRLSADLEFDLRPPMWFFYVPQFTPLKLLVAEGTLEGLARARAALEAMDEQMVKVNRKSVRIDLLSLLALVCDAQGDESTAFSKLTEALHLGEPGGFIRNFVDLGQPMAALLVKLQYSKQDLILGKLPYISWILGAFSGEESASKPTSSTSPTPKPLATPFLAEPLTEREIQVLKLLATELSPHEIAHELGISVTTVRTHTRNIYSKLAVHSRFEAVNRAEELGVL